MLSEYSASFRHVRDVDLVNIKFAIIKEQNRSFIDMYGVCFDKYTS